eukprot:3280710-Alexandrium_andersonii.AAC.1
MCIRDRPTQAQESLHASRRPRGTQPLHMGRPRLQLPCRVHAGTRGTHQPSRERGGGPGPVARFAACLGAARSPGRARLGRRGESWPG